MATQDWQTLSRLTAGTGFTIERVKLTGTDIAIEGSFAVPALAQLSDDDQIFVVAFVRSHGSIKQMEKFFGVSYPTIKNRLNRIGALLPLAEIAPAEDSDRPQARELLAQLEQGEITAQEVLRQLHERKRANHE